MWILMIIIDILAEKTPHIQEIGSSLPTLTWAACGVASGNPAARRRSPLGHPSLPLRMGTSVGPVTQDHSFTHVLLCICWIFANESTIFPAYTFIFCFSHMNSGFYSFFLKKNLFIHFGCTWSWLQCLESSWQHAGSSVIARKLPFGCGLRA